MANFRWVHKFDNETAYNNYMNNQYECPFVSLTFLSGDTTAWTSYRVDYEPYPIDLSEVDVNGFPTYIKETANCYVIKKTGWYEFPLVYGCAISAGTEHAYCYTRSPLSGGTYSASNTTFKNYKNADITSPYIETDTGDIVNSAAIVTIDASGYTLTDLELVQKEDCKYVRFKVTEIPPLGGNAVIAVKNSSNVIMWSWHIWAYPFIINDCAIPYTSASTETKYHQFMDVNVGWVKDSTNSKYGTSPYYEWGRKDPMPRAPRYNNNVDFASSLVYGTLRQIASANTLAEPIKNPDAYYMRGGTGKTGYGWISGATNSAPRFMNLWNWKYDGRWEKDTPGKTIYDPCPPGYQAPQYSQLAALVKDTATGGFDWGTIWYGRYFPALSTYTSGEGKLYSIANGALWVDSCSSAPTIATDKHILYASGSSRVTANIYVQPGGRSSYKSAAMPMAPIRVE